MKTPISKRLLAVAMIAVASIVGVLRADCPAHLPTNTHPIDVPRVTAHDCPELVGTVLEDKVIPFKAYPERGDKSPLWGEIRSRVVRSKKTQELHFYYQVFPSGGHPYFQNEIIDKVTIYYWGGIPREAWVGYRPDGEGNVAPARSYWYGHDGPPKLDNIMIQFPNRSYGDKGKALGVGSGDKSYWIVIRTKAKGYSRDGELVVLTWSGGFAWHIKGVFVPR